MPGTTRAAFALAIALASADNTLKLQLVDNTTCLDGTKAGYYYSSANGATERGKQTWVFYLQGGGACFDEISCKGRAKSHLGSSNYWNQEQPGDGVTSDDPNENPGFYDANFVYVPYGNGDTHRGMRDSASPETWGLYFTGHLNLVKILQDLEDRYSMLSSAKNVLIAGGSAGGIGTFYNADYLASVLNPSAVIKAAPNAGFFFPRSWDCPEVPGSMPTSYANFTAGVKCGPPVSQDGVGKLWGSYRGDACPKNQTPGQEYYCDTVATLYKYIKTPIYIIENQYDTNQIKTQEGCPEPNDRNPQAFNYTRLYGKSMRDTLQDAMGSEKDAIFSPSCFEHGVASKLTLNNNTWPVLLADWYWEEGKLADNYKIIEQCDESFNGLPCNPMNGCRIGNGPSPGPSPSGDKCKQQLIADGCLKGEAAAENECERCAKSHEKDLKLAGCTYAEAVELCTA